MLKKNAHEYDTLQHLIKKKEVFGRKRIMQTIYKCWYKRIFDHCVFPGKTLEIGSGFGFSKTIYPQCVTSEILASPWVDLICDAQMLAFKDSSLSNIIAIDVLHHIKDLALFFNESRRALAPKGRLVLVDMYVSPASYCVYRWGHFEDFESISKATNLFFRLNCDLIWQKGFTLKSKDVHDLLAYPLSGGFNYPSVLPAKFLEAFLRQEEWLKSLSRILAYKTTIVLEKKDAN